MRERHDKQITKTKRRIKICKTMMSISMVSIKRLKMLEIKGREPMVMKTSHSFFVAVYLATMPTLHRTTTRPRPRNKNNVEK